MAVVLFLCGFALIAFIYRVQLKKIYNDCKLPGPWAVPFIGNIQFITQMKPETIYLIVNNLRNQYKRTFRLIVGTRLWIFLHTPEETKQALNDSSLHRAGDFQQLSVLLGNGLLLSEGNKWKTHRKAIGPAFYPLILEQFTETLTHHADVFVTNLKNKKNVDVSNPLFLCVLDSICETLMGAKVNSQTDPQSEFANAFHEAGHILYERMVNPIFAFDFIYHRTSMHAKLIKAIEKIHTLTDSLVIERQQLNVLVSNLEKPLSPKSMSLLDILIHTKIDDRKLTNDEIKDEVNTFLFAGVDTTTASMCFVLYNLAKYENYQKKLYNEIITILSGNDPGQPITVNQINQMTFLDMFIKETQRLHTTVPLTGRQTTKTTTFGDITVDKGTTVWINLYGLAHDPDYFKNPTEFHPERFDPNGHDNANEIIPNTYLPYSGGMHVCIGKKYSILIMKLLTVKILLSLELFLKNPNEELKLISEMVLKSKTGINLIVQQRLIETCSKCD